MKMKKFGVIGKSINYSLSKSIFDSYSFVDSSYELINTDKLSKELLLQYDGVNITIPYKVEVIQYLDDIDINAKRINSVNCVLNNKGILKGYNTDYLGIKETLDPYINDIEKVMIFGSGGVARTLQEYFKDNKKYCLVVGRNWNSGNITDITYSDLTDKLINVSDLIVNATPVGTYPHINDKLNIPYESIKSGTVIFDLVYNPERTAFLLECEKYTNKIINGLTMLNKQAEESYKIWNLIKES